jgi:RHS repeat-associated protein
MLRGNLKPPAHLRCWLLLALLCWNALPGLAWASAVLPSRPAVSDFTCALQLSECALPNDSQAYLYTGEQIDPDLGMYYLRARYYQPGLGRFWSMDSYEGSQGTSLSLHKYLYCHGNPVNGTDPSGHEFSLGGFSAASSIGSSLGSIHNGIVSSVGGAMQASIRGTVAGKGMNEILTDFLLEETGIGLGVDAYQALNGYFGWGANGQEALVIAEFNLAFGVYVAPWLMTPDDEEAFDVVNEIYAPQCLTAGTPVDTANGLKAIETIRIGDSVWAWNEQTSQRELKRVAHTFVVQRNELVEILVDGVRVVATPDHPFFTKERRWKPAEQLKAGDALFDELQHEGRSIRSVSRRQQACTVYNMEVEGLHNFFVTSAGLLTHNVSAGYNHFFQNSFVKATGMNGLRYGKESLGKARKMGKAAHKAFHAQFNTYLDSISMRPGPGRSSQQIRIDMGISRGPAGIDQLAQKFRPFFQNHPKSSKWLPLFEKEVQAIKSGARTVN